MMSPQMKPVFSKMVTAIGYENGELHVEFKNGKSGFYSGVPADVGNGVVNAASIGTALHQRVKGNYEFKYNE